MGANRNPDSASDIAAEHRTAEKAKCSCCDKMAASSSKEAHACCGGKDAKSCCASDGKSCMKDSEMVTTCGKDCCGQQKTTAKCCDKSAKGCGKDR